MINKSTKILIVDDFELIRKILKDTLTSLDFTNFVEATSGTEAKQVLENEINKNDPVGLVFLDWNMPGESGIDILKYCRSHSKFKNLPIIMVTAEGEKKQVLMAFKEGANDYVVKPCSPHIIEQKVLNLIQRQKKAM